LNFEHYLTKIVASSKDGQLVGKLQGRFERDKYISDYGFSAVFDVEQKASADATNARRSMAVGDSA